MSTRVILYCCYNLYSTKLISQLVLKEATFFWGVLLWYFLTFWFTGTNPLYDSRCSSWKLVGGREEASFCRENLGAETQVLPLLYINIIKRLRGVCKKALKRERMSAIRPIALQLPWQDGGKRRRYTYSAWQLIKMRVLQMLVPMAYLIRCVFRQNKCSVNTLAAVDLESPLLPTVWKALKHSPVFEGHFQVYPTMSGPGESCHSMTKSRDSTTTWW